MIVVRLRITGLGNSAVPAIGMVHPCTRTVIWLIRQLWDFLYRANRKSGPLIQRERVLPGTVRLGPKRGPQTL